MKTTTDSGKLSAAMTILLAFGTGLTVATIYLLQPLLHTVSTDLGVTTDQVGLIITLTQAGYGLGILLLIPLGDVLQKKTLISAKMALLTAALILTGVSGSYSMILIGSLLVGAFATTAQDIVPFAADLTAEKFRGEVVGKVMGGLLLGILLSRTISGVIADAFGWRAVFWITSGLVIATALVLWAVVKPQPVKSRLPYAHLIKSTLRNFVIYPEMRSSILTQGLMGLAFSAFWTNLSFYLGRPPFDLKDSQIGLFGLAGAAGALAAPIAGKLSDRRGPHLGILAGAGIVTASFVLMFLFPMSIIVLLIGAIGFDLGVQMSLVSHQSIIYGLDPAARARLNALFVACMFVSFSIGSYFSVRLFSTGGWTAVLWLCIGASLAAAASAAYTHRRKLLR